MHLIGEDSEVAYATHCHVSRVFTQIPKISVDHICVDHIYVKVYVYVKVAKDHRVGRHISGGVCTYVYPICVYIYI